jgi:hypothetical protein
MNSSSERLVVFVTPAQKRVLAARAARLGISLSELVRRAVLAFDETGEEVRAAGLVDRLGGAHSPIAESDTLRRLAAGQGIGGNVGGAGSSGAPARRAGRAAVETAAVETGVGEHEAAALPVAAAVARALAAQAEADAPERYDVEDEAAVARVIANESGDLSRF